jgi:hypothetical protein
VTDDAAPGGNELAEAAEVDDEVDALTAGALSAATEDNPAGDSTELTDLAAPPAPEEEAITRRARTSADVDHLEVGLGSGVDLDALDQLSLEQLAEAEIAAIDEADPETAALIRDEAERRSRE